MPWDVRSIMDARMDFIGMVREQGLSVAEASQRCGVSRQTAYKWLRRFAQSGTEGLADLSRAPHHVPHRTAEGIEARVVQLRRQYPSWGPRKLRAWLARSEPGVAWPAASTMGDMLDRAGLTVPRRVRRRVPASTTPLSHVTRPNQVWSIDYKGQFRLGNGRLCYPLTVTDNASRMLLGCYALENTRHDLARACLRDVFARYGVPDAIRSDNGSPFASNGLLGLSALSAWWRTLGIVHERIEVGHPEQNGRHERMHLTLKQETTRPAADCHQSQQQRFDQFRRYFNEDRPHQALDMRTPASVHEANGRAYVEPEPWDVSRYDEVRVVRLDGTIKFGGRLVHISQALAGHEVGLIELEDDVWLVGFCDLLLGLFERGDTSLSDLVQGHSKEAA